MNPADRMLIEWQLVSLTTRFAHHLDAGDFESMLALFDDDGVFDRGGSALRGHAEIREGDGRAASTDDAPPVDQPLLRIS